MKFRNLATVASQGSPNNDVRCTSDADVMAVMYGHDGRCGRILDWRERVSAGD